MPCPWGNHALQQLRLEILTQSISQQVQPRVFYEEWEGKVVYVFEVPAGREALAGSVPRRVGPLRPGQPDHHRRLGRGAGRLDRREGRPAAVQRHPPQGGSERPRPLRGQPAPPARPDPGGPVHQRAEGQDLGLQGHPRAHPVRARGSSRTIPPPPRSSATWRRSRSTRSSPSRWPAWSSACSPCPSASTTGAAARPRGSPCRSASSSSSTSCSATARRRRAMAAFPAWLAMWAPNLLLAAGGFFLLVRRNRDKSLLLEPDRPLDPGGRLARHRAAPGLPPRPAPREDPRARGAAGAAAPAGSRALGARRPGAPPPPPADRLPQHPGPLCRAACSRWSSRWWSCRGCRCSSSST